MTDSAAALNRGILLALASVAVGVSMDALAKHLTAAYAVLMLVWARYSFNSLGVLAWAVVARRGVFTSHNLSLQLVRSALLAVCTVFMYSGLSYLPLSTTTAIGMVHPLVTTALAVPLLGERVGWRRWIAILVGFVGALVIIRPSFEALGWPVLLPVGMALCYALYTLATRRLAAVDDSATTVAWTPMVGTVMFTLALPWGWQTPTALDAGLLIGLGALGAGAHLLFVMALRLAPAGVISPFSYSALVWSGLFGYVLFSEVPDRWTLLGAGLIAGSGLYVWARERQLLRTREAAR